MWRIFFDRLYVSTYHIWLICLIIFVDLTDEQNQSCSQIFYDKCICSEADMLAFEQMHLSKKTFLKILIQTGKWYLPHKNLWKKICSSENQNQRSWQIFIKIWTLYLLYGCTIFSLRRLTCFTTASCFSTCFLNYDCLSWICRNDWRASWKSCA